MMTGDELLGKKCLVVGIANQNSIAYGAARALRASGVDLAVTYLNLKAEPHVRPLAETLGAELILPLDVTVEGQMEAVFEAIRQRWGWLDGVLHSIACAPKADLHGRMLDTTRTGFAQAMDISCHSFARMGRLAEPLMTSGGALITVSFYGAEKVIGNYGVMGPVKAALEATVRYMASELGPMGISVNAVSPGPISTRAGNGLPAFDGLLADAEQRSLQRRVVTIDEVGAAITFLLSPLARGITGEILHVDGGYHAASYTLEIAKVARLAA